MPRLGGFFVGEHPLFRRDTGPFLLLQFHDRGIDFFRRDPRLLHGRNEGVEFFRGNLHSAAQVGFPTRMRDNE